MESATMASASRPQSASVTAAIRMLVLWFELFFLSCFIYFNFYLSRSTEHHAAEDHASMEFAVLSLLAWVSAAMLTRSLWYDYF